jgi:hypothetical protein
VRRAPTVRGLRGVAEIVTHVGRVVIDGTGVSYTDDMQAQLFAANGFLVAANSTLAAPHRRLQVRALFGLFNAIVDASRLVPSAFDADATAVAPPTLPDNFVMFARRRVPCVPLPLAEGDAPVATPAYVGGGPLPAGPGVTNQ